MRILCKGILFIVVILFTFISIIISTLLLPIFIITTFSTKEEGWKEIFEMWKEFSFVAIDLINRR